jgi:arylsulfatase
MVYTFEDAKAEDHRKTQYFEIFGNSGIYHDGWFAGTTPFRLPWSGVGTDVDVLTTKWELYHIDKDFSQADDLAAQMPEKLREMQVRFYAEAAKHKVLPIQTSAAERFGEGIRPSMTGDRKSFTYTAGLKRIPEGTAPPIKNRSWSITTELTVKGDESGVIVTQGGILAGWALYFEQGKPVFSYSFTNGERWRFAAKEPLSAGKQKLVMNFTYDGGGMGKGGAVSITANEKVVAEGHVGRTVPFRFSTEETLDIGEDTGTPVDLSYDVPAPFTGELGKVIIDLK